ncbi:aldehyde dehydrogenase family protein, partial [Bacillus pumilus]
AFVVGDPRDEATRLGPLASAAQLTRVREYIERGIAEGAELVTGGAHMPDGLTQGYFVRPTVFGRVHPKATIAQEEIFGPVLAAQRFEDEQEALALANGTRYGLVAGLWTRDGARQLRLARRLRAGQVFINNYGAGGGVELPFGGTGQSGHGREKGFEALYGFTTLKTIAIKHG